MQLTMAAPTMVPGLRWLCSLMHTSGSRSAFRAGLLCSVWVYGCSSGRTSHQRTPRASGPRASNAVCHGSRARPRAAARQKFNRAKRFSVVNRGARTAGSTALGDLRVGRATQSSATYPVSFADGARSESAAASRSRPLQSRPTLPSFAAASADGIRLSHHDATASASS